VDLPIAPDDLAELDRLIGAGPRVRVALRHFDLVTGRPQYGVDLFAALRHLMMEDRKLVLLAQPRIPFAKLLPGGYLLSKVDIKTLELRGPMMPVPLAKVRLPPPRIGPPLAGPSLSRSRSVP